MKLLTDKDTHSKIKLNVLKNIIPYVFAVIIALVVGGGLIAMAGADPLLGYWALISGGFGGIRELTESLVKMTPLLTAGLGILIAFKCGFFNIGAEGQLYMGALFATFVGINLDSPLALPASFLAGLLGGGMWGVIPAILKVKRGVNEVISTVILNYIAIWIVHYMIHWPLRDPEIPNPQSYYVTPWAQLPRLLPGTRFHIGVIIAVLLAFLVYYFLSNTTLGYEIKATGFSPLAARYGSVNVSRTTVFAMLLSGGLAGIGGMIEVAGTHRYLMDDISPGYGYMAILVTLIANLHPLATIISGFFVGGLFTGAASMQRSLGVPLAFANVVVGVIVVFIIAKDTFIRYMLIPVKYIMKSQKEEGNENR